MEVSAGRTQRSRRSKGPVRLLSRAWRLPWRQGFNNHTHLGMASVLSGEGGVATTLVFKSWHPQASAPASSPSGGGTRSPAKVSIGSQHVRADLRAGVDGRLLSRGIILSLRAQGWLATRSEA